MVEGSRGQGKDAERIHSTLRPFGKLRVFNMLRAHSKHPPSLEAMARQANDKIPMSKCFPLESVIFHLSYYTNIS